MPFSILSQHCCQSPFNSELSQRLIHWDLSPDYEILDKDSIGFNPISSGLFIFLAHTGSQLVCIEQKN